MSLYLKLIDFNYILRKLVNNKTLWNSESGNITVPFLLSVNRKGIFYYRRESLYRESAFLDNAFKVLMTVPWIYFCMKGFDRAVGTKARWPKKATDLNVTKLGNVTPGPLYKEHKKLRKSS